MTFTLPNFSRLGVRHGRLCKLPKTPFTASGGKEALLKIYSIIRKQYLRHIR